MDLSQAFRQLRDAWFTAHLEFHPHEREWENEDQTNLREESNRENKELYDKQTETIIAGGDAPIVPRCTNDLCQPP